MTLSPNPAAGAFWLTESVDGPATYRCYDVTGREVHRGSFDERTQIGTTDWVEGTYTVELRWSDRAPSFQQVVVLRP